MTGSVTTRAADVTPRRLGAHGLLVADTQRECRLGVAAWVDHQLSGGAKVHYTGWLGAGDGAAAHWLAGPGGAPRAARALESGQLEIVGFPDVVRACGGTTEGLRALLADEVERAVSGQGWARVAMSQESACRAMADDAEAREFAAQEAAYDDLARRWPVTTLCQLTVADENPAAIWESTALHHHQLIDPQWSASRTGDRWCVRGTLDAQVAERFGAALYGALREARGAPDGPDLHIDLSGVGFVDLAFAQTLLLTARSVGAHQRVVVHDCRSFVRGVLEVAGLPPSVTVLAASP